MYCIVLYVETTWSLYEELAEQMYLLLWLYTCCNELIEPLFDYTRAVGHQEYGRQYEDQMVDIIRKATEQCDCLQSFFIIHSLGGGTYVTLVWMVKGL